MGERDDLKIFCTWKVRVLGLQTQNHVGKWLNNPQKNPGNYVKAENFKDAFFFGGWSRGGNVIFSGKDVDGEKATEWRWMSAEGMVPRFNFTTSELHHFGFWSPDVTMITWCYYNDMKSPGNLLRSNWPPAKITALRKVYPKFQEIYPRILPTQENDWSTNPPHTHLRNNGLIKPD